MRKLALLTAFSALVILPTTTISHESSETNDKLEKANQKVTAAYQELLSTRANTTIMTIFIVKAYDVLISSATDENKAELTKKKSEYFNAARIILASTKATKRRELNVQFDSIQETLTAVEKLQKEIASAKIALSMIKEEIETIKLVLFLLMKKMY